MNSDESGLRYCQSHPKADWDATSQLDLGLEVSRDVQSTSPNLTVAAQSCRPKEELKAVSGWPSPGILRCNDVTI